MNPDYGQILQQFALRYFIDRPSQRPSEWCCENLRFDEADNHGPFTVAGREYMIEPLDDFARTDIRDEVLVWGSQTRKTGTLMGGVAWSIVNDPSGVFWVMSIEKQAKKFSRNRWQKMLRASDATRELIPTKAARHNFSTLEQQIGASLINFVGSNSPGGLSSTPARRAVLDEVDKFPEGHKRRGENIEADAVNLAEQRTKDRPSPQRWKTSTPTIVDGLIWQEAQKGDMRRYQIPCKLCGTLSAGDGGKKFILAWSKEYCVLPKTGLEAYIVWDKEAKRKNGWDLDRVVRSARAICPHCGGDNLDAFKTWQNRNGVWVKTKEASANFVSRHLPSLYSPSPETSYGTLAKKFLEQKHSLLGLQGFINGDLAEPYQAQDRMAERIEIVTSKIEVTAEWQTVLTVDCQQKAPLFWFAVRQWNGGDSNGIDAGPLDSWGDVEAKQRAMNVKDACVVIDSGFGARSESDVYMQCARHGEVIERDSENLKPLHVGWMPSKGFPSRKRWRDDNGLLLPYTLRGLDPFYGTTDAGKIEMSLLEFSAEFFKDILDALRRGQGGYKWTVSQQCATEEYWRHLDCWIKTPKRNTFTGQVSHVWTARARHWPDHIAACEVLQIVFAAFAGFFKLPELK